MILVAWQNGTISRTGQRSCHEHTVSPLAGPDHHFFFFRREGFLSSPLASSLDGSVARFAHRPREWPKGALSPLIGPGVGGGGRDSRRGGPPLEQGV